jgi:MOSC domain-containing protein YiiM
MAKLLSIQVGLPQTRGTDTISDEAWESSIFKAPVTGAVWMGTLNLDGDRQSDLKNHGGAEKAVLAYAAAHYLVWRELYPDVAWDYGGFGENLTINGLDETEVCIGDIYAIGKTRVEVSQPRKPCWKLARHWGLKNLTAQVHDTGYTGWYLQVLQEGSIEAGMDVKLLERPYPQWTVKRANDIFNKHRHNAALNLELAACPALATIWKNVLTQRATKLQT